jgi:hypothetical protein
MRRGQPLGLDELMIVNPGPPNSGDFFLGEDGTVYQVQGLGLGQEEAPQGLGNSSWERMAPCTTCRASA